jgi:hypothetical protein
MSKVGIMKKVIHSGTIQSIEKSGAKNCLIIAGRSGKNAWIQNLEANAIKIEFDDRENALIIKIPLAEGQFVAISDGDGIAEQKVVGK